MHLSTSLVTLAAALSVVDAKGCTKHANHSGLVKRQKASKSKWSAIVAFGASYQDNGHTRPAQYKQYQRPAPYVGGRYTNGPVVGEYLATSLGATLFSEAYAGAVVNNSIPNEGKPIPDGIQQVQSYFNKLKSNSIKRGTGRVLHTFWNGINPINQVWSDWMKNGNAALGLQYLDMNVHDLLAQVSSVQNNTLVQTGVKGVDHLILPIPPLDRMLNGYFAATPQGNKAQLAQLKQFVDHYNAGLAAGIASFQTDPLFNGTSVLTYDVDSWFDSYLDLKKNQKKNGISNVITPCYDSAKNTACKNPATYFYFDTLHPTTAAFKLLADAIKTTTLDQA